MEPKFINGTSVNRVWGDHQEGELIAAFQYQSDAVEFARAKLAEDMKREFNCLYVVACSMRGTVHVIRQEKPEP